MTSGRSVVLPPDAVVALDLSTAGSPQQRALVSGLAVFMARLEAAGRVTASHVEAAASIARCTDITEAGPSIDEVAVIVATRRSPVTIRTFDQSPEVAGPVQRIRGRRIRWLAASCIAAAGAMALFSSAREMVNPLAVHPSPRQELRQAPKPAAPAPAVSPPPLAPAGLQPSVTLRVHIDYPQGDPAAAREGSTMARRLRDAGYAVDDPAPVGPDIPSHGAAFFARQDMPAAAVLVKRLQEAGLPLQLTPPLGSAGPGSVRIVLFGAGVPARVRHAHRHARRHSGR